MSDFSRPRASVSAEGRLARGMNFVHAALRRKDSSKALSERRRMKQPVRRMPVSSDSLKRRENPLPGSL